MPTTTKQSFRLAFRIVGLSAVKDYSMLGESAIVGGRIVSRCFGETKMKQTLTLLLSCILWLRPSAAQASTSLVSLQGTQTNLGRAGHRYLRKLLQQRGWIVLPKHSQNSRCILIDLRPAGQVHIHQGKHHRTFHIPKHYRSKSVRVRSIVTFLELFTEMKVHLSHPKKLLHQKQEDSSQHRQASTNNLVLATPKRPTPTIKSNPKYPTQNPKRKSRRRASSTLKEQTQNTAPRRRGPTLPTVLG